MVTEKIQVLIVDDEEPIRRTLRTLLEGHGYACTLSANAGEARRCLEEQPFALVLSDVNMPGESGLDLVRHIIGRYVDTAVMMVTGVDDPELANIALELGAYGYIIKPFEFNEILINVANALRRRRLEIENRTYRERLEYLVFERTMELREAVARLQLADQKLRLAHEEAIQRLSRAAEFRDDATAMHTQRVGRYCAMLAEHLGMDAGRCEVLRIASPMHDIGKVGIPDDILLKPGRLTPKEMGVMRRHAEIGYNILSGSEAEVLDVAAIIALTHHEKVDGSGYPQGLAGESIPVEGRIVAIADVFDALTSNRVYKPAFPLDSAISTMREGRGQHFDPTCLDLFFESMPDILTIREQYADKW
jgi:putative two-component system response regulator